MIPENPWPAWRIYLVAGGLVAVIVFIMFLQL